MDDYVRWRECGSGRLRCVRGAAGAVGHEGRERGDELKRLAGTQPELVLESLDEEDVDCAAAVERRCLVGVAS